MTLPSDPATRGNTRTKSVPVEQRTRERFFSLIGRHLSALYRFVRHDLAYFQAVGDLQPDDLTAEDVVDTAVLRTYGEFIKNPATGRKIRGRLIRHAREYIEAEARRRRSERERMVSIEQDIPDVPPAEWVTTMGEERQYFYEPDEDLKLEDIIPDVDMPIPGEETDDAQIRQCVARELAAMPRDWRWVLLFYADGLRAGELADAIGKSESETQRVLMDARRHLRARLIEAGCAPKPDDNRAH